MTGGVVFRTPKNKHYLLSTHLTRKPLFLELSILLILSFSLLNDLPIAKSLDSVVVHQKPLSSFLEKGPAELRNPNSMPPKLPDFNSSPSIVPLQFLHFSLEKSSGQF